MTSPTTCPPFQGLRTVLYHAPNLAKAKAWYSDMLGVAPYFDQPFYVGFNVGGYELGLDPDPSTTPGGSGGVVVYWGVSDIRTPRLTVSSPLVPRFVLTFRKLAERLRSPLCLILSATSSVSLRIHTLPFPSH